jgi:hypothetical protein
MDKETCQMKILFTATIVIVGLLVAVVGYDLTQMADLTAQVIGVGAMMVGGAGAVGTPILAVSTGGAA